MVARVAAALVLAASLAIAGISEARLSLSVGNDFGVIGDVGPYSATVTLHEDAGSYAGHFDCSTGTATVQGTTIAAAARLVSGAPAHACELTMRAAIGALVPGQYRVVATVTLPDGTVDTVEAALAVASRGNVCNANPYNNGAWFVPRQSPSFDAMCARLASDPAYRHALGDVVCEPRGPYGYVRFPELADPARTLDAFLRAGDVQSTVWDNSAICFSPPPADAMATMVEYYNAPRDHYFMTPNAAEQAAIDRGGVGPGWLRTGKTFPVVVIPGCAQAVEGGFHPIYRFAGIPGRGPDSHFFTATQRECAVVRDRADWGWAFEGAPFWASEPVDGGCGAAGRPLFRVYNDSKGGAPNHRYTTEPGVVAAMVAAGWIDEGVAMCL